MSALGRPERESPSGGGREATLGSSTTTRRLALDFLQRLADHDVAAALALAAPNAQVDIVPAGVKGALAREGKAYFEALVHAFPDLRMRVRRAMGTDAVAVVETTMDGTQAADFVGILNQEKYLDVDQCWMLWSSGGTITRVRAYWCQNQLLRRLAVKRLDQISITG